jgi:hypothetical protein
LVLRRFTSADADDLVSLDADPDVMRYVLQSLFHVGCSSASVT